MTVHFTNHLARVCIFSSVDEELREEDEHSSVETHKHWFKAFKTEKGFAYATSWHTHYNILLDVVVFAGSGQ